MKLFETPVVDVVKLNIADVITTSPIDCTADCPGQDECATFDCPFD